MTESRTLPTSSGVPTSPLRLPSLTGLRWFAAFVVFGFHVHTGDMVADPGARRVLEVLFASGSVGVPFFFILSGMVLTWSSRPGDRPGAFFRRRVARVAPNHVVTWLVVLAMLAAVGRAAAPGPSVTGLFLVQAWIPNEAYYFGGNTPAWSLSCEMAFYAAFPLLLRLGRRIPSNRLWLVALGLLGGIWLVPLASQALSPGLAYWFVWVFPVTRALEFALGMTLALLIRDGRWRGPGVLVSSVLVLAAYATVPLVWERWGWVAWMAGPFALLVGAAATSDLRGTRSVLRTPVLVWLGEVSFAFYLVHQPVIGLVERVSGHEAPPARAAVAILVSLALAIAVAWALYRFVERPMARRLSAAGKRADAA
ncbi:acyltransferase family protein [Planotetraspora kaengkrachanensis]|nr:acyltransferase [Planotetraspora kaengkrachanensis]